MKNFKLRLTALLLVLILLVTAAITAYAATTSAPTTYSKTSNSGTRNVVCTSLSGTSAASYYANYNYDNLSEMSSTDIFSQLQTLMRTTHSYTSSYSDCHNKADKTDCENGNEKVSLIYTSYSATMDQWNGWNREHVWPKSLGGNDTNGGGADLHHIRPSDSGVNSSRGNKKYGESGNNPSVKYGTDPAVGVLGGTYNSTYFEPLDNVKGDVARICLYVYVRWNSQWGADNITKVFQSVDILLQWCEEDPVDTWEMGRNEVVGKIQGNRNVFIDYPEYAWLIFGREVPANMTTPSGEAKQSGGSSGASTTTRTTATTSTSTTARTTANTSTSTTTRTTANTNTNTSATTTIPTFVPGATSSTTIPIFVPGASTSTTATTNVSASTSATTAAVSECEHDFGPWEDIGSTGGQSRTCSKCGMFEFLSATSGADGYIVGCQSSIRASYIFIALVPMLGVVCLVKKKKER